MFGGTSAAAPIAAGVGALVLSISPNLKWHEVRDVLQQAARKIDQARGQYDHTGHSNFYGYGQVDALQALQQIPALLEAERVTDTVSLDGKIRDFFAWVQRYPAGNAISSVVVARSLGILALLQSSPSFRDAIDRLLRIMADLAPQLAAGSDVTIPDQAWPAIELVARSLNDIKQHLSVAERSERSLVTTNNNKEEKMPTNSSGIEDGLNKIATILEVRRLRVVRQLPGSAHPQAKSPTTGKYDSAVSSGAARAGRNSQTDLLLAARATDYAGAPV